MNGDRWLKDLAIFQGERLQGPRLCMEYQAGYLVLSAEKVIHSAKNIYGILYKHKVT